MAEHGAGSTARALAVVTVATAALVGLAAVAWPLLTPASLRGARAFDELLVGGSAVTALAAGAWLWLAVVVVALEARQAQVSGEGPRGVPRLVRRAVLLACGVALVGGHAPALAAEQPQPVPGATSSAAASTVAWVAGTLQGAPAGQGAGRAEPPAQVRGPADSVAVRSGDTLWALAAAALPPTAHAGEVTRRWHRLHELNRAVIGDDPDLIHPGQRLRLPPAPHEGASS